MSGTNFDGDRGANRLATNNERELVPYFIEDPNGQQVVNESLKRGGKTGGGGGTGVTFYFLRIILLLLYRSSRCQASA